MERIEEGSKQKREEGGKMTYQKCPVCEGRGIVPQGFYDYPVGQKCISDTNAPDFCKSCRGTGVILDLNFYGILKNVEDIKRIMSMIKDGVDRGIIVSYIVEFMLKEASEVV